MAAVNFPSKEIEIFVSAAKGGPSDVIARIIADRLAAKWSAPVRVDHKSPMNACFDYVAKAPADGHTLVMGGGGYFINASLYRNLPFDPRKDFAPVSLVASIANVLVVHPSVPARTLREFIDYAKAHPGELKYGSSGFGGPPHLAGELFRQMTGADIVHVPYKSHVAAGNELVHGKDIQLMFDAVLSAKPHIDAGEVVPLAVTSLWRPAILPSVPTFTESGLPGYEINPDMGVMAPAATPPDIVTKISAAIAEITMSNEIKSLFETFGMQARGTSPQDFADYARSAFGRWASVLKNAGIEPRDLAA